MTPDTDHAVGRIITANTSLAYCEFTGPVEQGSCLFYIDANGKKTGVKVTYVQTNPKGGLLGHVAIEGLVHKPAPAGAELRIDPDAQKSDGVRLNLVEDQFGHAIPVRLNAMFRHWLLAGMTQSGKTHLGLAVAEELQPLRVPLLIIDAQNEFIRLPEVFPDVQVLDLADDEPARVLALLKERRTVVVPLLGLSDDEKASRAADILEHLFDAKEEDHADGKPVLPPMLTEIDEAEVFAPGDKHSPTEAQRRSRDVIEKILKRGSKLGLGAILIAQRLPMLHVEARSQCNSAALFVLEDAGSLGQLKLKGLTKYEQELVGRLTVGNCVLRGPIVPRTTVVRTRQIRTPRTKNVNFEELLGLQPSMPAPPARNSVPHPSPPAIAPPGATADRVIPKTATLSGNPRHIEAEINRLHGLELAKLCVEPRTTAELLELAQQTEPRLTAKDLEARLEAAYKEGHVGKGRRFSGGQPLALWSAPKPKSKGKAAAGPIANDLPAWARKSAEVSA